MNEIRLGTIGSGFIVHNILDAVAKVEGIRCVAVYSRTQEKGQPLAEKYGVEKVYTDMDAFLADEEMFEKINDIDFTWLWNSYDDEYTDNLQLLFVKRSFEDF